MNNCITINAFGKEGRSSARFLEGTNMGQRVNVNTELYGVGVTVATYGTKNTAVTFSAYKWQKDMIATLAEAPIKSQRFEGCVDGGMLRLCFDEPQAPGEYLLYLSDIKGKLALYRYDDNVVSKGYLYVDGVPHEFDHEFFLFCKDGVTDPFEKVLEYKDTTDGMHTPPPEAERPVFEREAMPDTWVFVDGLGRKSLTNKEVGDPRADKTMAMFYWDWHYSGNGELNPINIQKVIDEYPEAQNDYDHPAWNGDGNRYFWNEPVYGHYLTSDEWVLRRQAELLANAGVDVVFTDNTNSYWTWQQGYRALFDGWQKATQSGVNAPKISFFLPFTERWGGRTNMQLEMLYSDIYRNNKYHNMWYYLDGKPMILARGEETLGDDNFSRELKNFFTFRKGVGQYVNEGELGEWGWLSMYPQTLYYKNQEEKDAGKVEQTTVGISVNFDYTFTVQEGLSAMNGKHIVGRSYTDKYRDRFEKEGNEASLWGYNFTEQFDYALNADPKVIFVTGWNEWNVHRHTGWRGVKNAFADQFTDEFSRDIEPSRGRLRDNYYYLFVNYARKFKGARPIPTPSGEKNIDLFGGGEQWANVQPYYAAYKGNTFKRDHKGWGSAYFKDDSGRNDIVGAQVARDGEKLYFRVECADDITPHTDKLWMNLYIDTDGAYNGWESFNYTVRPSEDGALALYKFTGNGYEAEQICGVEYCLDGKYLTVKIPKSALGLGDKFTVNFAWTDNVHDKDDATQFNGEILEFYTSGDVAPGGRFKYSYICE